MAEPTSSYYFCPSIIDFIHNTAEDDIQLVDKLLESNFDTLCTSLVPVADPCTLTAPITCPTHNLASPTPATATDLTFAVATGADLQRYVNKNKNPNEELER